MAWRQKGISIFRQSFNDCLLKNLKSKRNSSSWKKCEDKITPDDCTKIRCKMDEMIDPCGDWSENFKAQDAWDTKILLAGIGAFSFSFFLLGQVDLSKRYNITFLSAMRDVFRYD